MLKTGHTSSPSQPYNAGTCRSHPLLESERHCSDIDDIGFSRCLSTDRPSDFTFSHFPSVNLSVSHSSSVSPTFFEFLFYNFFFEMFWNLCCFFLGWVVGGELCQQFKVFPRLLFLLRSQHAIASLDRLRKVRSRKIMNAPHSADATLDECGAHTGTNRLPTR